MHKTRNDLPKAVRKQIIDLLDGLFADAIDLTLQCKQAHWNVRGPSFIALHELFDKISEQVEGHVDALAERMAALGAAPAGTVRSVAKRTRLKEYPLTAVEGPAHVDALAAALADFGARARQAIDKAGKLGDQDSADLCTGISRDIDQQLWFVEAHAQAAR
jgi:starvation-inducible DNA-binding protein